MFDWTLDCGGKQEREVERKARRLSRSSETSPGKEMAKKDLPQTFHWNTDSSVYLQVGKDLGNVSGWQQAKAASKHDATVWLVDGRKKNAIPYALLGQNPARPQLVNHYRGSTCLTLKSMMVRTITSHCKEQPDAARNLPVPMTFVIYPAEPQPPPAADGDAPLQSEAPAAAPARIQRLRSNPCQRADFLAAHAAACKKTNPKKPLWIAKGSAGCKGDGIVVSDDADALLKAVDESGSSVAWVLSEYIAAPFLYRGRKFDIRCWVLLDHNYRAHIFEEGVARTTSSAYSLADLSDRFAHLTNHFIQEQSEDYSKYEPGNELSFAEIHEHMQSLPSKPHFYRDVLPQMERCISECFAAAKHKLETFDDAPLAQMQLFGFDFLVDADLKVWLLEINGSPACRDVLLPDLSKSLVESIVRWHREKTEINHKKLEKMSTSQPGGPPGFRLIDSP